ncbi:Stemmadenine O-acetyltransferase [Camellia lanceoleosa]|uniref:Stemmadenine O-acetyltransferase n=1 Tax=Camellia lanceoleosa TaxID=1840588 RepID=A0ACC0HL37_9ERIC|nr:Stemmadenine O-acetyltransferase [Camellia lanceoleosa]
MLDNDNNDRVGVRVLVISQLLKKSLSQVLTRYYPLAGKIKDALTIDCNDDGVFYAEARVKCNLSDFLTQPHCPSIGQLLPREPIWSPNGPTSGFHVIMFQVNIFDCGGFAIGAFFSHLATDGTAMSNFFKSWAAIARGSFESVPCPSYIAPSLFLQNESVTQELTLMAMLSPFVRKGNCVTKRFTFDASALATLKAKASTSRVQAVSSLFWKCFMAASKAKTGAYKPSFMTQAVNMRKRALPPFPESCMGNFLWLAVAECKDETETELDRLVGHVKEAIAKVDAELVKELQGEEGFVNYCETVKGMSKTLGKEADCLAITSLVNFGLYEVDFGWGKPMWISPVGLGESRPVFLDIVILVETKSGDGIEAWAFLEEQVMDILQSDTELLSYATIDPKKKKRLTYPSSNSDDQEVQAKSSPQLAKEKLPSPLGSLFAEAGIPLGITLGDLLAFPGRGAALGSNEIFDFPIINDIMGESDSDKKNNAPPTREDQLGETFVDLETNSPENQQPIHMTSSRMNQTQTQCHASTSGPSQSIPIPSPNDSLQNDTIPSIDPFLASSLPPPRPIILPSVTVETNKDSTFLSLETTTLPSTIATDVTGLVESVTPFANPHQEVHPILLPLLKCVCKQLHLIVLLNKPNQ